jgi:hypothetical protein
MLRDAFRRSGLPLAAVLLVAFLSVISAKAQSASPAPTQADAPPQGSQPQTSSQVSSQAAAQSSRASSASPAPVVQNVSAPPQQSLGDAARQNAQKAKPKPKHVYTDDDLSSIGGRISVVGDASSSNAASDADSNAEPASGSSGAQDEEYWRGQANAIKNQIADVDRQIEDKKTEIAKAGATSFDPSAGLSQGVIVIHDRNAELKDLEDRKQSLENQLDQLADEGRKAGADSGWFR